MLVLLFYVYFVFIDYLLELLNSQLSVYLRLVLHLLRVLAESKSSDGLRQVHLMWRAGDNQSSLRVSS